MGLLLAMCLTGCKPKEQKLAKQPDTKGEIQIGLSIESFVVERWERDRDIFISTAAEYGATVNVQNANGSVEEQKKQINYFIEQEMDVIVIIAVDSEALYDEVENAHAHGIKVIAYDRQITDSEVDLYITFDNRRVGELMAEELVEKISDGSDVLMISGPLTDSNVYEVDEGFLSVASEHNWNIVDTFYADNWNQDLAYEYVCDNLDVVQKADAVMCGNDALAGKTINAMTQNRLLDGRSVVGQDADLEACQRIVEGTQYLTIYKPINTLATQAAEYAVSLAKGESIEGAGKVSNGDYLVPYVAVKPYAVTKDNIDVVIIDSGFHQKSDVYLNIDE